MSNMREDVAEFEKTAPNYWDVQEQDVVCIPSLSFDTATVQKIVGVMHYEERQLFNLLLLKHPKTRIIFITSQPLDPEIIQYYVSLLPSQVPRTDLEKRLIFLPLNDGSQRPLAEKIMERPHLIDRIKQLVRPGKGLLLCFTVTNLECELVRALGIPIFGNDDPKFEYWGSKSGSREVFAQADIPHARGIDLSHSSKELVQRISKLYSGNPVNKMVVKLNQGFSGQGNALLDLSAVPHTDQEISEQNVLKALLNMSFSAPNENWKSFHEKITDMGAIAEEFFEGEDPKCPSVQGCISLNGQVEILSTHEQVMKGQVYQGCLFPASESYRSKLHDYGRRVGKVLAEKGVHGHYGVDFLVQAHPDPSTSNSSEEKCNGSAPHDLYALEINLRQCGTTHPYFAMKFLTDGKYDPNSGLCYSSKGNTKYYKHSDNLHKEQYKGILPSDLLDLCAKRKLVFDHKSQCGPVFHLLGALSEFGKVGITSVGDSAEEASSIFSKVEAVLEELGAQNLKRKEVKPTQVEVVDENIQTDEPPSAQDLHSTFVSPKNTVVEFGDKEKAKTRLLITVCIHGDEVCGLHAINQLISEGYFEKHITQGLHLTVIMGNPLAYLQKKRFIDNNLNRVLLPHMFENGGYETYRARRISEEILECDMYLDVHSSSAASPSMMLPAANEQSVRLAATFPVAYVVKDLVHATQTRGTTMDWAFYHHKNAVSMECGQHDAGVSISVAKNAITHFIAMANPAYKHSHAPPKMLKCISSEKVRKGFKYNIQVKPFDHIKHGQIVAFDDEVGPLKCELNRYEGGALIIMPTKIPYLGEEAFFWAVPEDDNPQAK